MEIQQEMSTGDFDLRRLLHPEEPTVFLRIHWEKSPYVLSRESRKYYSDLFSIADVDSLICLTSSDHDISVVKTHDGELSSRTIPRASDGTPDIYFLYRAYHEGYTIVANGLHRRWGPIASLCRTLEAELSCRVGANLYFTPQNAQGFKPHFDTHDVFVLQLEGSKTWRLYDIFVPLPLDDDHRPISNDRIGSPRREVILEAGDLLYIPRGHVHEALTSESASLHLTVGLYVHRWIDLVRDALLLAAEDDVRFREAVPVGFLDGSDTIEPMKHRLRELLGVLTQRAGEERVIRRFAERFFKVGYPAPDGHFVSVDQVHGIDMNTVVRRRSGMMCSLFSAGDLVGIRFPGNAVTGPVSIEPALQFIAGVKQFSVKDLPDFLSDNAKRVLVSRLVREGLFSIVRDSTGKRGGEGDGS